MQRGPGTRPVDEMRSGSGLGPVRYECVGMEKGLETLVVWMCRCRGEKVDEGWSDVPRSEKAVAMERRVQVIGLVSMTGRRNRIRFLERARCGSRQARRASTGSTDGRRSGGCGGGRRDGMEGQGCNGLAGGVKRNGRRRVIGWCQRKEEPLNKVGLNRKPDDESSTSRI